LVVQRRKAPKETSFGAFLSWLWSRRFCISL